jgi:adenine deaminase
MEALRAGTAIAAKAMKLEHEVGTIEPGKRADLVLFDGDPLSDIESLRDLERILLVLQGGRAVSGKWLDGQQCTDRTDAMRTRRETVEHPFGTIKARMGATHFLMKRLPNVAAEMALHVLAYNLTRVMNILGRQRLIAAIKTG